MTNLLEIVQSAKPYLGFYWGANYPYIRPIWVTVQRSPKGVAASLPSLTIGPDVNPAAIIYESKTDTSWGMGCPSNLVDDQSFIDAATTLGAENFGLSLMWVSQSSVEEFINIVLEHIDASLFLNPKTGLHTIKLIRDDYDVGTLKDINPDNARLNSFQRRGLGETINEMVCTWTNPETEKEETVTLQSLGNIARQGAVVSSSINYFGVRNRDLAMKLCARELRKASMASATCEVQVNREFWDVLPGDVVTFTWPEYGASGVVMRIVEVDYGEPGDSWITLKMTEDVFSLPILNYVEPPGTQWQDPRVEPEAISNFRFMTLPAYMVSAATDEDPDQLIYPEALVGMLATTTNIDTSTFTLGYQVTSSTGAVSWALQSGKNYVASGVLPEDLPAEPQSTLSAQPILSVGLPISEGCFLLFDLGDEAADELAHVYDVDASGYHLNRGVLDTIPTFLPAGTKFWVITHNSNFIDDRTNSDGETLSYKLLMRTSLGVFDLNSANTETGLVTDRAHRPSRPANVAVEGIKFTEADLQGLTSATITWANRNRLTEISLIQGWTEGDTTPETGQTSIVRVLNDSGTLIDEYTGLTGTSYELDLTPLSLPSGFVEVAAERDGFESLQAFRVPFIADAGPAQSNPGSFEAVISGTQVSPTYPNNLQENDRLILIIFNRTTLTPPAGWTLIRTETSNASGTFQRLSFYTRVVPAGGLTGTVTINQATNGRLQAQIHGFRKQDGTVYDILDHVGNSETAQEAEVMDFTHITPTVDDGVVISALAFSYADTSASESVVVQPAPPWVQMTPATLNESSNCPRMAVAAQAVSSFAQKTGGADLTIETVNPGEEFCTMSIHLGTLPAPAAQATHWRVRVSRTLAGPTNDYQATIGEIEFRETAGVPETPSGGTAFGSAAFADFVSAFDGSTSTNWSTPFEALLPHWVGYQFASPRTVEEVVIKAGNQQYRADRAPTEFRIQYSNDGNTWYTALEVVDEPGWASVESRSYSLV